MMNFDPMLEDDKASKNKEDRKPLTDGAYGSWRVWDAVYFASPDGDECIKATFLFKDEFGGSGFPTEFFSPKQPWKIKPFLAACGHESEFKKGNLTPEFCKGKEGLGRVKQKPGSKWWKMAEFIKAAQQVKSENPSPLSIEDEDDDIPF